MKVTHTLSLCALAGAVLAAAPGHAQVTTGTSQDSSKAGQTDVSAGSGAYGTQTTTPPVQGQNLNGQNTMQGQNSTTTNTQNMDAQGQPVTPTPPPTTPLAQPPATTSTTLDNGVSSSTSGTVNNGTTDLNAAPPTTTSTTSSDVDNDGLVDRSRLNAGADSRQRMRVSKDNPGSR